MPRQEARLHPGVEGGAHRPFCEDEIPVAPPSPTARRKASPPRTSAPMPASQEAILDPGWRSHTALPQSLSLPANPTATGGLAGNPSSSTELFSNIRLYWERLRGGGGACGK